MKAEPQKEHLWLEKLVGDWTYESEAPMAPDQPPSKFTGTESVRSLGGVWFVCEGRGDSGETPEEAMTTIMSLGYDPVRKRYVGTFIGSMMTHLWLYEGELDPTGKILTLDSEGPSFTDQGKMGKYKDSIEFKSDDHRVLTSNFLGDDGKWQEFMTAHYRRK
jgi:hypothetical protein